MCSSDLVLNHSGDATDFILTQVSRLDLRLNTGSLANLLSDMWTDPVNVSQRHVDALVRRDVDPLYSWHRLRTCSFPISVQRTLNKSFSLTLFMAGVGADDAKNSVATDQFAVLTDPSN